MIPEPTSLEGIFKARAWQETVDGVLTDLLQFAAHRGLGLTVAGTADRMHITLPLAERYESAIIRLVADLNESEAAPGPSGTASDPTKEIHS